MVEGVKGNRTDTAALPLKIVAGPTAESDAAVARYLTSFLEGEQPGTSWQISKPDLERAA